MNEMFIRGVNSLNAPHCRRRRRQYRQNHGRTAPSTRTSSIRLRSPQSAPLATERSMTLSRRGGKNRNYLLPEVTSSRTRVDI